MRRGDYIALSKPRRQPSSSLLHGTAGGKLPLMALARDVGAAEYLTDEDYEDEANMEEWCVEGGSDAWWCGTSTRRRSAI